MADGSSKAVHALRKGDVVSVDPNNDRLHAKVLSLVESVVEGDGNRPVRMCEMRPGFLLTPTHPLLVNGTRWIRPEWEFACDTHEYPPTLFNIILEEGPHYSVNIEGFAVATWVKYPVGVPMIDLPYKMQRYRVIEQDPGFAAGHVKVDAHRLIHLKTEWLKANKGLAMSEASISLQTTVSENSHTAEL